MAVRTITETVQQTRTVKLWWRELERKRRDYPHEFFTVYALIQSGDEMLGYINNEPLNGKDYWCVYEGDANYARPSNGRIPETLEAAKEKLLELFADK